MPSMRCLMTAGPALKKNNAAAYNCVFVAIDNVRAFDEALLLLMLDCGVGFSVERQYVSQLPTIPEELYLLVQYLNYVTLPLAYMPDTHPTTYALLGSTARTPYATS